MSPTLLIFFLIALATLIPTAIAFTLRNIIRSVLLLVVSWVGIAAFYLWAGAEFVAFAQILVYVGAISMIVLFGIVLTRRTPVNVADKTLPPKKRAPLAIATAALVALAILWGILGTHLPPLPRTTTADAPTMTMHTLGLDLMGQYAGAVLIIGALLTVALLGAIILAAQEQASQKTAQPAQSDRSDQSNQPDPSALSNPIPQSAIRNPHSQ